MKKLLFATIAMLLSVTTLSAEEKIIDQDLLPKSAQTFISTYYPNDKVSIVTMDRDVIDKDYKVTFDSGVKVEFDDKGDWTDVESKRNGEIPKAIVPTKVASYVEERFPSKKIVKIEKDKKSVEVELDNGIELKFNNKGNLIEIDN